MLLVGEGHYSPCLHRINECVFFIMGEYMQGERKNVLKKKEGKGGGGKRIDITEALGHSGECFTGAINILLRW